MVAQPVYTSTLSGQRAFTLQVASRLCHEGKGSGTAALIESIAEVKLHGDPIRMAIEARTNGARKAQAPVGSRPHLLRRHGTLNIDM